MLFVFSRDKNPKKLLQNGEGFYTEEILDAALSSQDSLFCSLVFAVLNIIYFIMKQYFPL